MKVYNEQSDNKITEELNKKLLEIRQNKNFNAENYVLKKANLLNKYMSKYNLSACIVAISGGIDSAIVLGIVKYASTLKGSPIKKIAPLLLPISKSIGVTNQAEATKKGEILCEKLKLNPIIIDLSEINQILNSQIEEKLNIKASNWAIGQLGPYTRTPTICYTSTLLTQEGYNSITVGTTNRSEFSYIGYVGKFSDEAVDIQLISDIYKSEVYQVANFLNIPKEIINAIPNGDMYDNRTDEMVFGASYDFLELYLEYLNFDDTKKKTFYNTLSIESKKCFDFYAKNIENLHKYNFHKYMAKSPAIHLDLWDSSTKGGLDNYYIITQKYI